MAKTQAHPRLAFTVLTGPWHADGEAYVDVCEVKDPSDELVKLAAGAHTAGVIVVTDGLAEEHTQSQEAGEAAYAAAQESGEWQVGNELQHRLERAQAAAAGEEDGSDDELAAVEAEIGELSE